MAEHLLPGSHSRPLSYRVIKVPFLLLLPAQAGIELKIPHLIRESKGNKNKMLKTVDSLMWKIWTVNLSTT